MFVVKAIEPLSTALLAIPVLRQSFQPQLFLAIVVAAWQEMCLLIDVKPFMYWARSTPVSMNALSFLSTSCSVLSPVRLAAES